jgi:pantoate--beta-alanine ligase
MSSRNRRLSAEERAVAPEIYQTLLGAKELAKKIPVSVLKGISTTMLESKGFRVDYFELADIESLQPIANWEETPGVIACMAAFLGSVRLIDNMILFANFAR